MVQPKLSIGRESDLYSDLMLAHKLVLQGSCLVIDPSAGSNSSLPGWAFYFRGDLIESGVYEISRRGALNIRLQELSGKLRESIKQFDPDVLVYEDVPPQRYGGGNAEAHATLIKALGVVLSVPGPRAYVGVKPIVWRRFTDENYIKGDREDAEKIGEIVYRIANEVEQDIATPRKSKKQKTSSK